jgi:predicted neutral ceramidase superfamily lipid hydrolase
MSQQEMDFGRIEQERPGSSYTGYEGVHHSNDFTNASYGQKLSPQATGKAVPSKQRLALAIVSLVLWVVVFLIAAVSISSISPENPISRIAYPFLILALLLFSAIVFFINFLFNRKY